MLVWLAKVLLKSSYKKQIPLLWLSVAVIFDTERIHQALCLCDKIRFPVMGDKTGFRRFSHKCWKSQLKNNGAPLTPYLFKSRRTVSRSYLCEQNHRAALGQNI